MNIRDKHRLYGLTQENYLKLLKVQNKVCAICGQTNGRRELFIDHDHTTGQVRGLLCTRCNSWLAAIEDKGYLRRAKTYLAFPPISRIAGVELDPVAVDLPGWKKRG